METAFQPVCLKACLFKDFSIRKKINLGAAFPALSHNRKKALLHLNHRTALLIGIMIDQTAPADLYIHIFRKGIYHRGAYAVKTAAGFICLIVKLAARMKGGKNDSGCRNAFLVHFHRNPSSIVLYSAGTVLFQFHPDLRAKASQMLVHCIIYNLIDQMVQSLGTNAAYVHTRPLADGLQAL